LTEYILIAETMWFMLGFLGYRLTGRADIQEINETSLLIRTKSDWLLKETRYEVVNALTLTWFIRKSLKIPKGGNQSPYIVEEQKTQWPKEKLQKHKQRSTKHTYKTKDRVTRTPMKIGGELRCSGRV